MSKIFSLGDAVKDKHGIEGKIVPMPKDYAHGSEDDLFVMARLVYVQFGYEDPVLIPESRISHV